MKTQVLQGINLENDTTTIKIALSKNIDVNLINEIKNYHPIFLKSYTIKNNVLIIQSKLPNLWKEIGKILHKKESKKLALEIVKKQIKSMSTITVLDVADKMNEEITQFLLTGGFFTSSGNSKFNRQYAIGCGIRSAIATSFSSSKDSQLAKQIQTDKYKTNRLIDRLSIPSAPWEEILSEGHLKGIFKKYKTPVVIKPTSFTGGRGVHIGIKTLQEGLQAYKDIVKISSEHSQGQHNKIIIQEQIDGEDYRLLVINGTLEAATKRIPAFLLGNGKNSIKELIQKTNQDPKRNIYNPTHILKPILIDEPLVNYLNEQGLNLKYIPKKDEKILVRKVASMSQGGITQDFTDKVNKQIKYITESLAQSLRAYVLGIDVICKDISKPLTKENGGIIEVNTMPEAYLNMYPVLGPQRPQIAQKFVDGLLTQEVKQTVVIGGQLEQVRNFTKNLEGNIGIYSNNTIYINNEVINKDIPTHKATQSLKINSYLKNITFHYQNIQEVQKYGLGFDRIDTLYIQKSLSQDKNLSKRISSIDKKLIKNIIKF